MKQILKKIKKYNTIIIHGHTRPDGDCYGSQFGLKKLIEATYPEKKVYVVGGTCDYCKFLGQMDEISDDTYKGALAICVDCATAERLADQRYNLAEYVIKIDHHISVDAYGDYQYVEEDAPACTQIITDLAKKGKLKMTKDAAFALYTGLVTDTGRFRFDSITPHTFMVASYLLKYGVNPAELDNLLSVDTLNILKLKGYVLSNFEMTEEGFAYIKMTRDIVEKYGVTDEEAANQVSTISTIEGCPVWALFMEYPGNEIRIRLRSRGPVINTLAEEYNGGGHAKAAGASLNTWDDLDGFVKKASAIVKQYKEENK